MSKESLERFLEQVGGDEVLKATIEDQLDNDGYISADTLIALGADHGCAFTFEDLRDVAELSDEDLDQVAGGGLWRLPTEDSPLRFVFRGMTKKVSHDKSKYKWREKE